MQTEPSPIASAAGLQVEARKSRFRELQARLASLHRRYEKYTGMAIFALGFIWDSLTLTRVDNLLDNAILLLYIAIIGCFIILILRRQSGTVCPAWILRFEPRFIWIVQFCFGGLFSSYVVFYFKSASFTRTQFFFLLLVILWVGNEFLYNRLQNKVLLAVLYCLCLLSFMAFFLPVILARVHWSIFVLAGLLSLILSLLVFALGLRTAEQGWRRPLRPVVPWMAGTVLAVNVLYFANLIPPVPLALKSAGIYHHVARTSEGYEVSYVPPPPLRFWKKWDDPFYLSKGELVYCFTAIFAPRRIHVPVRHVWSRKTADGWAQTDRIRFEVAGGREAGYRGFTRKRGVAPGRWRVEVQTESGQILGRIDFSVVPSPDPHPRLHTRLIR